MIIRRIKENYWKHVYNQITTYGRAAPMSLQFDVDINCNGVDYILKVQPKKKRRIVALQALGVYADSENADQKDYRLIEDNLILTALLEIIIFQGANKRV